MKRIGLQAIIAILAVIGVFPASSGAQSFSEPATVFYGKVLGTGSVRDFLITQGDLSWTILRSDGKEITLTTALFALQDGSLSYRLNVPHSAFALGLSSGPGGVPLPPSPQTHLHKTITVDGDRAVLLGPAGSTFTTEQLLRTATYRLDLAIGRAALDSDGDGIPDEWEDRYGLDKQDRNDAGTDANGDGLTALDAYLRGLDPRMDARAPTLLTHELLVYRSGRTGILLDTADLNSTPFQLTYTLTALPSCGVLARRNGQMVPGNADVSLAVGDVFTQADMQHGRVVFIHDGTDNAPGSFSVEVRDENPANPASSGSVLLLVYAAPSFVAPEAMGVNEAQRIDNAVLSASGYVVLDGSPLMQSSDLAAPSAGVTGTNLAAYVDAYGHDRSYVLIGGRGHPSLAGGEARDVLTAGPGDASLTGGPGPDLFLFRHFDSGLVVLSDFSKTDADVVDLSRLPTPPGAQLQHFLRLVTASGIPELQVDLDGNGAGYTNIAISLPGLALADADIYGLVASGALRVGNMVLEPRISIVASQPQASENGPTIGRFTLQREGSLAGDLVVTVSISGSALNGSDYEQIQTAVTMPAGAAAVDIDVTPYADNLAEPTESVRLLVVAGSGYRIGPSSAATVTIEDRLMLVGIEVLEPLGVKATGAPASILITRRDVVDRDVVIRLLIGGTAANGTDYNSLASYVTMGANQTSAIIQVVPKPGASLNGGAESVRVTIKADAAYRVTGPTLAEVLLVERLDTLAAWQSREFPAATGSLSAFASQDSGSTGMTHLQRYAFGMNPLSPDKSGLPRVVMMHGQCVLTFRKPAGITDVTYRVSGATDLMRLTETAVSLEQLPPSGGGDPQQVYYRIVGPGADALSAFLSVELEWRP